MCVSVCCAEDDTYICRDVILCVAGCYSVLQCVAVCVAVCCADDNVDMYTGRDIVWCRVLQRVAVCCSALRRG